MLLTLVVHLTPAAAAAGAGIPPGAQTNLTNLVLG